MTDKVMVRFDKVSKTYGDKTVVKPLSFTIKEGEFITILGTSGSGKTTILKMMNRLIDPTKGDIYFDQQDIKAIDPVTLRRQIGYVVQETGLFPHMTVGGNIAVVPKLLKWEKAKIDQRVTELLQLVQLPAKQYANRYPDELSGGQQQRVGVARALAADPNVMLFDEPFGAIDAITRTNLQDELLAIHQKLGNKTFIFITHDIHEAFRLGSRVMIMDEGQICQFDAPKTILTNPQGDFVKRLIATGHEQQEMWGMIHD